MQARDPKHSKETGAIKKVTVLLFPLDVGGTLPVKFGALTLLLVGNILPKHLPCTLFKLLDAIQIGTIMVTLKEPQNFEVLAVLPSCAETVERCVDIQWECI